MTQREHRKRHQELHEALDELVADCIIHTPHRLSKMTVSQLIKWSAAQAESPTEQED